MDLDKKSPIHSVNCQNDDRVENCGWINDTIFLASTYGRFYYCNLKSTTPLYHMDLEHSSYSSWANNGNIIHYLPIYSKFGVNLVEVEDDKYIKANPVNMFDSCQIIKGLTSFKEGFIAYDDYTVKEYQPGMVITLFQTSQNIEGLFVTNDEKTIMLVGEDSVFKMDFLADEQQRIVRTAKTRLHRIFVPNDENKMYGIYRGCIFEIGDSLNEVASSSGRHYIAKGIYADTHTFSKDGQYIYTEINGELCAIRIKNRRKALPQIILHNLKREGYILTDEDKTKYEYDIDKK